jgi:methyltransferase-like protein
LFKAALVHLAETWPGFVRYDDLLAAAAQRLEAARGAAATPTEKQQLADSLVQCCTKRVLFVHSHAECFEARPTGRPVASPLARYQARHRQEVSNRRHEPIALTPLDRWALLHLDGSVSQQQLIEQGAAAAAAGRLRVTEHDRILTTREEAVAFFGAAVPAALTRLAQAALLVG